MQLGCKGEKDECWQIQQFLDFLSIVVQALIYLHFLRVMKQAKPIVQVLFLEYLFHPLLHFFKFIIREKREKSKEKKEEKREKKNLVSAIFPPSWCHLSKRKKVFVSAFCWSFSWLLKRSLHTSPKNKSSFVIPMENWVKKIDLFNFV